MSGSATDLKPHSMRLGSVAMELVQFVQFNALVVLLSSMAGVLSFGLSLVASFILICLAVPIAPVRSHVAVVAAVGRRCVGCFPLIFVFLPIIFTEMPQHWPCTYLRHFSRQRYRCYLVINGFDYLSMS